MAKKKQRQKKKQNTQKNTQKNTEQNTAEKQTKSKEKTQSKTKKDGKENFIVKSRTFLEECFIELKKVQWPTKKQVTAETLVVFSTVIVVIIAISIFDFLLNFVFNLIIPHN